MQKKDRLKRIYDRIPSFKCNKDCHGECCGPVAMSLAEAAIIQKRTGVKKIEVGESLLCPFYKDNACSIYSDRPVICRLFGVVDTKEMRCPHSCAPERLLSDQESRAILRDVSKISKGEIVVVGIEGVC